MSPEITRYLKLKEMIDKKYIDIKSGMYVVKVINFEYVYAIPESLVVLRLEHTDSQVQKWELESFIKLYKEIR